MATESWLKIALPAYPVLFTIFGVWLYWGDNARNTGFKSFDART